jgi:hypothetical protein
LTEDQGEPEELAVGITEGAGANPNRLDLLRREDAFSPPLDPRLLDQDHRARIDDPSLESPIEHLPHRRQAAVGQEGSAALLDDPVEQLDDVAPSDFSKITTVPMMEDVLIESPPRIFNVSTRSTLADQVLRYELIDHTFDLGLLNPLGWLLHYCGIIPFPYYLVQIRGHLARFDNRKRAVQTDRHPALTPSPTA